MELAEPLSQHDFFQLKSGNKAVFQKVYEQYFSLLLYISKRCGMSHEQGLDIVQETFIALYNKVDQIKDHNSLKSWLITTARNLSIDTLRKSKMEEKYTSQQLSESGNEVEIDSKVHSLRSSQNTDRLVSNSQLHEIEILLLADLIDDVEKDSEDNTFSLFYRQGLSAKQIALQKGESVGTVTNRLSRLRKRFKTRFKNHLQQLRDSVF